MGLFSNIRYSPWSDGAALPPREVFASLCERLNRSLGVVRESDLDAIERNISPQDKGRFRKALGTLAPWRTLKGFGLLAQALTPHLSADSPLCLPLEGSAADVLAYLVHQKNMFGGALQVPLHKGIKCKNGAILLDRWSLNELERNSKFARSVQELHMRLLFVPGMNDGLKLACGRDLTSVADLVRMRMDKQGAAVTIEDAAVIKNQLQRYSLGHRLSSDLSRHLIVCSVPLATDVPSPRDLVDLLTPHPGIEDAHLEAWAKTIPVAVGNPMLELLASNTKVLSLEVLFKAAEELHHRIELLRRELAVENKPLWCFAPDECNSMQLALFLMRLVGAPVSVVRPGSLTKLSRGHPANETKLIAVFDDVALTGDTLLKQVSLLRDQLPSGFQVIFSGVFASTAKARENFEGLMERDRGIRYASVEHVPVFADADVTQRDDEVSQKVQRVLTQFAGYGGLGTMVVLPFGAPNNNHLFFNQTFASLLTLGGRGIRAVAGLGRLTEIERAAIQNELLKRLAP